MSQEQVVVKERQLAKIETELQQLINIQEKYNSMKQRLDLSRHELNLVKQRLQQTTHHRQQEEVNNLKFQIGRKSCIYN